MLSSLIVSNNNNLGFGANMEYPTTGGIFDIMGVLYIDDTDLFFLNDFS